MKSWLTLGAPFVMGMVFAAGLATAATATKYYVIDKAGKKIYGYGFTAEATGTVHLQLQPTGKASRSFRPGSYRSLHMPTPAGVTKAMTQYSQGKYQAAITGTASFIASEG